MRRSIAMFHSLPRLSPISADLTAAFFGIGSHHHTFILMATDLDPKDSVLKPGMTRDEPAAALQGQVKASAGLVARFKHP